MHLGRLRHDDVISDSIHSKTSKSLPLITANFICIQLFKLSSVSSFVVEYLSGKVLKLIAEGGYFVLPILRLCSGHVLGRIKLS